MIDLSAKTYKALLTSMLARVPDAYDKRDTSPIPTALGPAAWGLEGVYLVLNTIQGQAYIQTATGEDLDLLSVVAGTQRRQASAAVRLGVFNMAVPVGARFSTVSGADSINFTVTAPTDDPNQAQLTAETPGAIGNDYTGPILPITTIPGLTSAQITDILTPGEDVEDDDSYRARVVSALNERPYGGNIASYRAWLEDIAGVGPAQVWPTWAGGGTVKLSVLGADLLPASTTLLTTIKNTIDPAPGQGLGLATIGATVTVVAPRSVTVNVDATLALDPGYTLDQVRSPVTEAVDRYITSCQQGWGNQIGTTKVEYNADVFHARVVAAILSVSGILNATGVTLNGSGGDITLTQSGQLQQVPVLGAVTLNV